MKIIKKLSDMMWDELEGAERYVRCAINYKVDYPSVAKTMYDLSFDEMDHMNALHGEAVKLIEAHRRDSGEPPEAMQIIYDYIHEKLIDKANKIKVYQEQYKSM